MSVDWTSKRTREVFTELLTAAYADRVRMHRIRDGRKQAEIAEAIGTHRPIYSRIESGRHLVSFATLERLATAFGVPLAALAPDAPFDDAEQMRPVAYETARRRRGGEPCARVESSGRS